MSHGKRRFWKGIVLLVLTLSGGACGGDEGDDSLTNLLLLGALAGGSRGGLATFLNVDLSSSRGMVIGGQGAAFRTELAAATDTSKTLYNINSAGQLEVVRIVEGGSFTAPPPARVHNLASYVIFDYFGSTGGFIPCGIVIGRKSDDALFCAHNTNGLGYIFGPNIGAGYAPTEDASGNIYFAADIRDTSSSSADFRLWRVSPSGSGLTRTGWVNPADFGASAPGSFAVNPANGAVLVNLTSGVRVRSAAGGLTGVGSGSEQGLAWFVPSTPTAYFYVISFGGGTSCRRIPGGPTFTPTSDAACGLSASSAGSSICRVGSNTYTHQSNNRLYQVTDNSGITNTNFQWTDANSISKIRCSGSNVYVQGADAFGNGLLGRFNVAGGTFTTLLAAGDYSIASFDVAANGDMSFAGVRNSDGAKIVAEIPAAGGAPVVTSVSVPDVSELVRLN